MRFVCRLKAVHELNVTLKPSCAISAVEARHSPEVEARGSNPRWHELLKPLESMDSSGFFVS